MTPYYRSQDGRIVVYHCSIEALIASGVVPIEEVALVHGDPPYGVRERTERAKIDKLGPLFARR